MQKFCIVVFHYSWLLVMLLYTFYHNVAYYLIILFIGWPLQGMQSDNGSMVYYLPGYNPYASGTVVGVDGQSVAQQPYFSSSGYLQQPVSYGSEAVPCYSWDSTYVGDVPNGNTGFGNGKCGSGSPAFAKSNGLNAMKSNGNSSSKFFKPTYTQPIRPLNKV